MADKKISALTAATTPLAGSEVLPIVQGGSTVKVSVDNLTAGKDVSAAKLSVNTTSTASKVVVGRSSAGHGIDHGVLFVDQNNNNLAVVSIEGYSTNDLQLLSGSGIRLYTNSNLANSGLVAQIDTSGNITANTGNLVMGTAGKGIDFSANTHAAGMTSELLNDYEEGTFTATLAGFSANPTTPVTSTARYTKVGRQVSCQINFVNVDTTGASGAILINGLPFAAATDAVGISLHSGITAASVTTAYLQSGQTQIQLFASNVYLNAVYTAGAGQYLLLNITYTV